MVEQETVWLQDGRMTKIAKDEIGRRWEQFKQEYDTNDKESRIKVEAEKYWSTLPEDIRDKGKRSFNSRIAREQKDRIRQRMEVDNQIADLVRNTQEYFEVSESRAIGQVYAVDRRLKEEEATAAEGILAVAVMDLMNKLPNNKLGLKNLEAASDLVAGEILRDPEPKLANLVKTETKIVEKKKRKEWLPKAAIISGLALIAGSLCWWLTSQTSQTPEIENTNQQIPITSKKETPTAIPSPTREIIATQTATSATLIPTIIPTATEKVPSWEERNRLGYQLEGIDLKQTFSMSFPDINKTIQIDPAANTDQKGPDSEIKTRMKDWKHEPNFGAIYNTDKETGQYAVLCHGFDNLPCDWLDGVSMTGETGYITQGKNRIRVKVSQQEVISLEQFAAGNVQGYNQNDPAFIATSNFGIEQTEGLVLIECIGQKVKNPKLVNNNNPYDFSKRSLTVLEIDRSSAVVYDVAKAEYKTNGFEKTYKDNMRIAAKMINEYFLKHPISKTNPDFSYINAMDYFQKQEWKDGGKGACDISTLVRRAMLEYLKQSSVRVEEQIQPPGVKTKLISSIINVDWYRHPQESSTQPEDLALIQYYTPQTNTDMIIKLDEGFKYNLPDDWRLWVEIEENADGMFTAIVKSTYN